MPVTLTIKQVPEALAEKLRQRAGANHRSLQGELMAMLHQALAEPLNAREPETPSYRSTKTGKNQKVPVHGARMTLEELWERSRKLGGESDSESAQIARELRDARHRR